MTLQEQIEGFVSKWGPSASASSSRPIADRLFSHELRFLLNAYARAAIQHGNIPEVGSPHGGDNARTSPEGNNSPAPPSNPVRAAWRVTVKRGRDRRVLVFEDLPDGYEKGDTVYLAPAVQPKGGGALELWTVQKIEKTEILARIPRG